MNPYLDQSACANCRMCYRRKSQWCRDNCRRCSIAMFSEDEVNVYPYSGGAGGGFGGGFGSEGTTWPYPPNYPYAYPSHNPVPKSYGRVYYNYPRVTNQYYPSMLPYGNYYGSLYRPSITYW